MTTSSAAKAKAFHIALWVAQALLALAFISAGVMKSLTPIADLAKSLPWAGDAPALLVRFIGLAELAGGIGLVLPALTRVKPLLTPLAAVGLALIMAIAAFFHLVRGEFGGIGVNVVLGGIALFIAWGRVRVAPIQPRA